MRRTLSRVLATLPFKRRAKTEQCAGELAALKGLRQAVEQTQEYPAVSLGVGQDIVSRIERRSDMLFFTLRRYEEAMGGKLEFVAELPDRPRIVIDQLTPPPGKVAYSDTIQVQARPNRANQARGQQQRHEPPDRQVSNRMPNACILLTYL